MNVLSNGDIYMIRKNQPVAQTFALEKKDFGQSQSNSG
jgi:hypothetical protein